jgi:protein subunit release factor B
MGERQLLFSLTKKDFELQFFRCGGKGGQKQNKTSSGCRVIHRESGAVGESREERSQIQNKKNAFERCVKHPKFKIWHSMRVQECLTKVKMEDRVNEMMNPKNILIECKNENDEWEKIDEVEKK